MDPPGGSSNPALSFVRLFRSRSMDPRGGSSIPGLPPLRSTYMDTSGGRTYMDTAGGSSTPAFNTFRSIYMDTSGRSSTSVLEPSGGSSTPAFPTQLSSYNLVAQISAGVNGVVHVATCLPLDSSKIAIVAIKSIDLNRIPDYLRMGAKFMSLISHPNILTAHCFFTVGTHLKVVMPFMSGGSLHSIISSSFPSGLTEEVIAVILKQTLEALHYLHSQDIHHGDIKAANIFIDLDGSVKLTDFGHPSRTTDDSDDFRCAPEVIQSHSRYGLKADIWSFGVTAMELAYGRRRIWQLFPPQEEKNFSRIFKDFVTSCLAYNPSERCTASELLNHRFIKNCNSKEYLVSSFLNGLPSVQERFIKWKEWNNKNMIYNPNAFAFVPVTPTETGGEGPIDVSVLKEENETLSLDLAIMKMEIESLKKDKESLKESLSMVVADQLKRQIERAEQEAEQEG